MSLQAYMNQPFQMFLETAHDVFVHNTLIMEENLFRTRAVISARENWNAPPQNRT